MRDLDLCIAEQHEYFFLSELIFLPAIPPLT